MPLSNGVSRDVVAPYLGDGHGSKHDEMPLWSGDGRGSWANPLFPMYGQRATGTMRASGDGQTGNQVDAATTSDVVLTVNPPPAAPEPEKNGRKSSRKQRKASGADAASASSAKSSAVQFSAPQSDTWKLVALVFVFLVWITTASTLLFLYMDRYLFP
ncbi:MAG: hypothetical protein RIE53_11850 [Rhodothermales bacterium]